MTSLATAIEGMKHWDWCPICRGGLDTGLECDQCGADLMPIYKAFKDVQARPTDSSVLRGIKARADRSRLGYGGKAWVTSDPKSEVVEDRMILIEIVGRQEFAINRLRAALNEAADSFKNAGLSVDAEDCEQAINESLSGGNPGEPKACTPAEERGIVGATGAGQPPEALPDVVKAGRLLQEYATAIRKFDYAIETGGDYEEASKAEDAARDAVVAAMTVRPVEPLGTQWIQCSERIPPEDTPVLILRNGELRIGAIFTESPGHEETFKAFNYWDDPNDDGQCWEWHEVTHWMPLPSAPSTKAGS